MAIKVKNVNGTGTNARSIDCSWLEYWKKQTGRKATQCMAYDEKSSDNINVYRCPNTQNIVGGHVIKVGLDDKKWYILPICASHNKMDSEYWAKEEDLVPVDSN